VLEVVLLLVDPPLRLHPAAASATTATRAAMVLRGLTSLPSSVNEGAPLNRRKLASHLRRINE
jgi:hypothetical protein